MIGKEGVDHAPIFTVKCVFEGMTKIGKRSTVKSAEQNAAKSTLENIYLEDAGKERFVRRSQTYVSRPESDSTNNRWHLTELKHQLSLPDFVTSVHLMSAFTHSSINAEENYQRLEFLGDSILRMLIIDYLLRKYPKIIDKAFLSPLVDKLVSAKIQIKIAKKLHLHKYVLSSASITEGILSDVLEALIAAIYIDAEAKSIGTSFYNSAAPIIINWFKPEIVNSLAEHHLEKNETIGSDNFSASTMMITGAKAPISADVQVRSIETETTTTDQVTKKPQAIVWSDSTVHENFPALSVSTAKAKTADTLSKPSYITAASQAQASTAIVSTSADTHVRSYAKAATTKQVTKKPQVIVWSDSKVHEDFPALSVSTTRTKTADNSSKLSYVTAAAQAQTSTAIVSTLSDTQGHLYATGATRKQVTKKAQAIVWSAPKIHEDFPTLSTLPAKTKTTNDGKWRTSTRHFF